MSAPAGPKEESVGDRSAPEGPAATGRGHPWIGPAVVAGFLVAILAVWLWEPRSGGAGIGWFIAVGGGVSLVWTVVGSLVASRERRNPIGWIVLAVGLAYPVWGLLNITSATIVFRAPTAAIGPFLAWATGLFLGALVLIPFMFLLFPDGHPPSRRWRLVGWLMAVGGVLVVGVTAITPDPTLNSLADVGLVRPNPVGIEALSDVGNSISFLGGVAVLLGSVLAVISLWLRFRRSSGEQRQQIRWLAAVGGLAAGLLVFQIVFGVLASTVFDLGDDLGVFGIVFLLFVATIALGIPLATGVAVLRYRLYDLDVVVKKTVVFAIVAAAITLGLLVVFVALPASLVGTGMSEWERGLFLVGIAIGLLLGPLRRWARGIADRVVYGRRATPYEVLTAFSERVGETYAVQDVLPRMASVLASGTGASSARVLLRVGSGVQEVARWPTDAEVSSDEHVVPVVDQGEELGALALSMPANDPMNPAKDRLVRDLASQAGLVLRNVRLIEELRASRQRLVAAQDHERRRIERDIHDGAQQQLVALAVRLRLADTLVGKDEGQAHAMLAQLQEETTGALENLRDLARGIYPPLLADKGLSAALEAQARKSAVRVTVDADGVDRYPQEVEAAVYFCTLEALNNVAKYADATAAHVRLHTADGALRFEVEDDGRGFDPSTASGSGLTNMRDRLDALGGSLDVRSSPGAGTTIAGRIPAGATG